LEIVAQCIANALFYSQQIRPDVLIHVVLDGPADPPKTIRFDSQTLGSLDGFDERSICKAIMDALAAGNKLALGDEVQADDGIFVAKKGFERLLQEKAGTSNLFCLDKKGVDIRDIDFPSDTTFVFTDHLTMPKKTGNYLLRLGAQPISVGPKTLFASQCIVLAHNELDRKT